MQQRNRRLVFMIAGSLLATAGVLAACSTDNGTTALPGQTGIDGSRDSSRGADDDTLKDDGGATATDAGANCDGAPTARSNKGVFCFGGEGSVDGGGYCDPAENKVCCADEKGADGKFVPAKCATATVASEGYNAGSCNVTPDAGGREWHCTEAQHCPNSGEVCCVVAGSGGTPTAQPDTKDFPGCGNFFNNASDYFVGGSRCRADSCNAGELTLCASDAECETGTCHFFKIANRYAGVCK